MSNRYWTNAASGSTAWDTTTNWNGSTVPVTGDDVTVYNSASSIDSGLAQSGVTLATLVVPKTFTGSIGSSSAYLAISATSWRVGDESGSAVPANGSGRLKLNFGANAFSGVVVGTGGSSTDAYLEPLRILGTHASNKLFVLGGTVGIATTAPGEASTLAELSVEGSNAVVNVGAGVTLSTTVRLKAGTLNLRCAGPAVKQDGGTLNTSGTGGITSLVMTAGTAVLNATGTIATLEIQAGATADFLQSSQARAVTNAVKMYPGATLKFDPEVVDLQGGISVIGGSLDDVTIVTPKGLTVTLAAA